MNQTKTADADFGLSSSDYKKLIAILFEWSKGCDAVQFYAFGSRARLDHSEDSDLDLLLCTEDIGLLKRVDDLRHRFELNHFPVCVEIILERDLYPENLSLVAKEKRRLHLT